MVILSFHTNVQTTLLYILMHLGFKEEIQPKSVIKGNESRGKHKETMWKRCFRSTFYFGGRKYVKLTDRRYYCLMDSISVSRFNGLDISVYSEHWTGSNKEKYFFFSKGVYILLMGAKKK